MEEKGIDNVAFLQLWDALHASGNTGSSMNLRPTMPILFVCLARLGRQSIPTSAYQWPGRFAMKARLHSGTVRTQGPKTSCNRPAHGAQTLSDT